MKITYASSFLFCLVSCSLLAQTMEKSWMLGPFVRPENAQPVLQKDEASVFIDPITQTTAHWESMATFNPA
ncbi:MAG: pesticidal protein Cry15Aa, partial [Bacteroidota bacterium]|nr:pesticidal protein Cry15Aa [Bacteroidota bacterium]